MKNQTIVEWRKGETGMGGTYTFSPRPTSISRPFPAQRKAQFDIPDLDGGVIQIMGLETRRISVSGVIYVYPPNFDNLMTVKNNMESGIGTGVGQFHIYSHAKHIYYAGILDGAIDWGEQNNMYLLEYKINFIFGDPIEYSESGYSGYGGL